MPEKKWIIDVNKLTKNFDKRPAVSDLNLQVGYGEIYGFLGPNGAGKTTSLRMLCGLITPDSGVGECVGYDILTQSRLIKTLVGYVSQNFGLYNDLTVHENMEFFAGVYGIINKKAQIEKYLHKFHLNDRRNDVAKTLSGGWKQRLSLAVALLHDPLLLLLDEPTANIDPKARREFWLLMHQLSKEGITILLSSHNLDEVLRCDKIAYMCEGRTLIAGTVAELINNLNITTWAIEGRNLSMLARQLENSSGVDQVLMFHDSLHVSGENSEALATALAPYLRNGQYRGETIKPNLEDLFVWLSTYTRNVND